MKRITLLLYIMVLTIPAMAQQGKEQDFVFDTKNTTLYFTATVDAPFAFRYYGKKVANVQQLKRSGALLRQDAYPAFGINCINESALHVTHSDGNMSTELHFDAYTKTQIDDNVTIHKVALSDPKYPFYVNLFYKTYYNEDVIEVWTEISHTEKRPVTLFKYASFQMPLHVSEAWLTHFHGEWGGEFGMVQEKLNRGLMTIKNREGVRNTQRDNPSFMLTLDEQPSEDHGEVIAGALAYTGNYKISFESDIRNTYNIVAGINEEASQYVLEKDEVFETPKFILTHSNQGKGQVSRNMHTWARQYKLLGGNEERMVLLNSWEGVYFKVNEPVMFDMIDDIAALGGELFVMDDGWFGDKYPRNNGTSSLGDWMVCKEKLPNGLQPLIDRAEAKGIKFGIWFEPEMINDKSELFEQHPEWVISQPNRETVKGRGNSQMTLDMSNPEVQDFVYHTIHNVLVKHPKIAYIKWDANHFISNYGSNFLPANKQSHLYIEYHRGLKSTLERIRKDHPDVVMQACASGGGRVSYGYLPYFHEFWTSDNTDALTRIYMQWGTSHFFPAIAMASHVSAAENHQTKRILPLKFRFDVAMTGRLGMEMQPKDLTENEKGFAKNAISTYKQIRPIVQFGDLYRINSPFDGKSSASLMYVSREKDKAVYFVYAVENWHGQLFFPPFKMKGLDADKKYRVTEINKMGEKSQLAGDLETFSGDFLMSVGLEINLKKQYDSSVVLVEATE